MWAGNSSSVLITVLLVGCGSTGQPNYRWIMDGVTQADAQMRWPADNQRCSQYAAASVAPPQLITQPQRPSSVSRNYDITINTPSGPIYGMATSSSNGLPGEGHGAVAGYVSGQTDNYNQAQLQMFREARISTYVRCMNEGGWRLQQFQ